MTVYDFEVKTIDGHQQRLDIFRGQVLLIVNVASQCGFTPQYRDLEALWRERKDKGLVVLGVPSNDFGRQEPGSAAEISFQADRPSLAMRRWLRQRAMAAG